MSKKTAGTLTTIALSEFKLLPLEAIKISVIRFVPKTFGATTYEISIILYLESTYQIIVYKRYTEFQALYDTLAFKYKNISLPEFPSKFQFSNKEEQRVKFFDVLLNTIMNLAKNNPETKKAFLTIIYDFLIKDQKTEMKKEKEDKQLKSSGSQKSLTGGSKDGVDSKDSGETSKPSSQNDNRRNSFHSGGTANQSAPSDKNSNEHDKKPEWNNIHIKIGKEPFFQGYIKITQQSLLIFKNITLSNFVLMVPLYKINYDLYRSNYRTNRNKYIEPKELYDINDVLEEKRKAKKSEKETDFSLEAFDSEITVKLYHTFGLFDLSFKFTKEMKINKVALFVKLLEENAFSGKSNSIYMLPIDETNQNIYGNVYLEIKSVTIPDYQGQCFVKILLDPYQLKTKTTMHNSNFIIKQAFLIPIHNRFSQLKFEVYSSITEGLLLKKVNEEKLSDFTVQLPEILNTFFVPTEGIYIKMTNENKSIKLSNNNITLNFRIIDYSSLLSLTVKNRNKKTLEDMTMEKNEDDIGIKNLLKRMKKMIHVLKELDKFYKTVFRFKYPYFSSLIMVFSILFFLKCQTKYLITHIIFLFFLIGFAFSELYEATFGPYFNKYIFSYKNPYDFESKFIKTEDQKDREEIMKKDYLIEKSESNIISSIIDPLLNLKEYMRTFKEVVFSFTKFVSTFEKLKNLFLWTDPLLSFYFMALMVLLMLIVYHIEFRYVLLVSFTKKFIAGMLYYKSKHKHNLEIGRILLEYVNEEWKKQIKTSMKSENTDWKKVKIYDEKFKIFMKEEFMKHSQIFIKDELFNSIENLGDIQLEMGKADSKLKIKKFSHLYHFTLKNPLIMDKPIEPEDIFLYFIQNIKSDYYIKVHSLDTDPPQKQDENRFNSLSNESFEALPSSNAIQESMDKDNKGRDNKSFSQKDSNKAKESTNNFKKEDSIKEKEREKEKEKTKVQKQDSIQEIETNKDTKK